MSIEDEELLIGEVLKMKERGFETSRSETLPSLYMKRYGGLYNTSCGSCVKEAFDQLVKWATKKRSTNNQNSMAAYKFKREFHSKVVPILWKGNRLIITSFNLTDELAQIILAIPKYSHILEPTGEGVSVTTPVITKQKTAKPEKDQVIAPKLITTELEKDPPFPNEPEAKESKVSTSTSKEVKKEEIPAKKKPGRPARK